MGLAMAIRFRAFSYRHVAIVPRFPVDLTVGEELHTKRRALNSDLEQKSSDILADYALSL